MLSGSNDASTLFAIAMVSCAVLAGSSTSFEHGFVAMPTPADARAFVLSCQDLDADGFFGEPDCGTLRDCNDSSAATYPGAPEICDGYDNDCDAELDDNPACDSICDLPDRVGDALRVTDAGASPHGVPSLIWTGSANGVTWVDSRDGSYDDQRIYFARTDGAGNKIGTDLRVTNSADASVPSLVWTGAEYGVSWEDTRNGFYDIYFARLDATGNKMGNDLRVTYAEQAFAPSVVWTGSEYGMSWYQRYDYWTGNYEIYFARLDAAGNKIGTVVRVTTAESWSGDPSLAWTGSEYGVTWQDSRDGNSEIYFARIDASGNKIGTDVRLTNADLDSFAPSLVWTGSGYGVAWRDFRNGNSELYFARIDAGGNKIGIDVRLTDGAPSVYSSAPSLVWTGAEYGVSWVEYEHGIYTDIYFARIDAAGSPVGSVLRITNDVNPFGGPSLVWTGTGYGVSWRDALGIQFARIGCDCFDLDLDGVTVCNDCDDDDDRVFPGAPEVCDGVNNDCHRPDWPSPDDADSDSDGFAICDGDCDDTRSNTFPGAAQVCDGVNNDCDAPDWPSLPADETDGDGDSSSECQGDCDDSNPAIGPAELETCNQLDDNCNGLVDEDGFGEDTDGDRLHNVCDNCALEWNPTQTDSDADDEGDFCDLDDGLVYIRFHQPGQLTWQNESGFATWNSYRGDLQRLRIDGAVSYTQDPARVPLAATSCDLTTTSVTDDDPPSGTAVFFLVTGNYADTGEESSLGVDSSGAERLNRFFCP